MYVRACVNACVRAYVITFVHASRRQGAKLGQRDKLQHEQPDVVHHARQRRVLGYWDARRAPRPFVDRLPVQPDPRSNRQQVLDPRTLPGREPVRVAVQLHAPKVRLELELEIASVAGDFVWKWGGVGGAWFLVQRCNHLIWRKDCNDLGAHVERRWINHEIRRRAKHDQGSEVCAVLEGLGADAGD